MPEVHSSMQRFGENLSIELTVESNLARTEIWPALTEPAQISRWLGHTTIPLDEVGSNYELTYLNGSDHVAKGEVLVASEPDSLVWSWNFNDGVDTVVRFSLSPRENGGTTFRFTHENVPVADAAADAATWHAQFEFLSRWLLDHIALGAHLRERRVELIPQYEREVELVLDPNSKLHEVPVDTDSLPIATTRSSAWA